MLFDAEVPLFSMAHHLEELCSEMLTPMKTLFTDAHNPEKSCSAILTIHAMLSSWGISQGALILLSTFSPQPKLLISKLLTVREHDRSTKSIRNEINEL